MNRLNGSYQEFTRKAQQIFEKRGWEQFASESTLNGEFLLFTRNETLHLVYCLPFEMYVTTIEIQICDAAQIRLGAKSSSVLAPHRFSQAAIDYAEYLGIELLEVLLD